MSTYDVRALRYDIVSLRSILQQPLLLLRGVSRLHSNGKGRKAGMDASKQENAAEGVLREAGSLCRRDLRVCGPRRSVLGSCWSMCGAFGQWAVDRALQKDGRTGDTRSRVDGHNL